MYVGNPSNMRVMALGMGVAIDQDNVLVGASNSDNFLTTLNEGGAFRMPFHFVSQSGNWRAGDADEIGFASADALVFPNPAIGNEVEFNSLETVISAEAVSVIGEVFALNTNLNTITVGALPKGVYTLKITTESGNKFKKFIKE